MANVLKSFLDTTLFHPAFAIGAIV